MKTTSSLLAFHRRFPILLNSLFSPQKDEFEYTLTCLPRIPLVLLSSQLLATIISSSSSTRMVRIGNLIFKTLHHRVLNICCKGGCARSMIILESVVGLLESMWTIN